MLVYQSCRLGAAEKCPYLPDRESRLAHFLADAVDGEELEALLASGWRHFGFDFFRPFCPQCRSCIPLRIDVHNFGPTRSQRRNLRKNSDVRVEFCRPSCTSEAFRIFRDHSAARFQRDVTLQEFYQSFYAGSTPSLQSNYYLGDRLVAVGFLDTSTKGLSSVYFIFDPRFSRRGLGTFSVLVEVSHCAELGLRYYYLGYLIEENRRMLYKGRFFPHERYDWKRGTWEERMKGEE